MPPREPSVEDDDALGAQSSASYVRRSQTARIPGPARVPIEALSLPQRRVTEPPDAVVLEHGGELLDDGAADRLPSLPPRIARFAHFEVLGRIAVGGMAEIYLGRDSVEGGALRQLAIKVLRRQSSVQDEAYFEELFLREGRTAAQLVHPNICHIYSFGKWRGHLYIAMEWIDGVSLSQVMQSLAAQARPLDPLIAASVAAQVAGALDYAHHVRDARRRALAIVHRDVNPQNIMIRHDGMVKLLDFGVAQVAERDADSRSDTVKGKFSYMAPEQAQQKPIDGRADVFALGVCLYEMLTGTRLYKRKTLRETVEALLLEPVPVPSASVPSLPAELDDIVRHALAKDPNDRFASAADMQAALETFLAHSGEVVSARRISSMMETIYPEARGAAPSLFTGPEIVERLAALEDEAEPQGIAPSGTPIELPLRSFGPALLALTIAVLLAIGGFVWFRAAGAPLERATSSPAVDAPKQRVAPPQAATVASPQVAPEVRPASIAAPPPSASDLQDPSASKREGNAPRRRRRSPDFVATPGF